MTYLESSELVEIDWARAVREYKSHGLNEAELKSDFPDGFRVIEASKVLAALGY
ncbi:MAG: hypothetical protein JKY49_00420 [Cohaesibacteraceae bacterium]|nr:hypothetical protein [Cohaesibacteraceae bacterium]MBL4875762.1 hypothetical protein [Cohaesibacteraceae bacterium]